MKVQDLMTRNPQVCRDDERLAAAVRIMWEHDCGSVPVVDAKGALTGIVTDRDACMASYTRGQRLDEITVRSAMAQTPVTCRLEDPVEVAEAAMQKNQVHRLPVVDGKGQLVGIISSNDLLRMAAGNTSRSAAIVAALSVVCAPRRLGGTPPATTPARADQPSLMQAPAVKSAPSVPLAASGGPLAASSSPVVPVRAGKSRGKKK
jgi:CBS domain-containing protein